MPSAVCILNAEDATTVTEISSPNVIEIQFSPKGTYFQTWERLVKMDDNSQHLNMNVWLTATGEKVASFSHKNQSGWALQYTSDEKYCAKMVTGEVQFYESANMSKGVAHRLKLEGVANFAISPGRNYSIAAFVAEKKGAPAAIRIYQLPSFSYPVAQKTFYRADKVQIKWNDIGTSVLVIASTDVDRTNKSYYGESSLLLLSVAGNYDCRVNLDKEGAVHDVTWCPGGKEFIVVYGFMPSKTQLFDHRANPVHDLGINPRNFALPSPHGRYICIAGFGNLNGTMDIWDRQTLTKTSVIQASNTSACVWSPDGRYLLTAILSPRLRVDNGVKIWHAPSGTLVYVKSIDELYQVGWRPMPVDKFPLRGLSPAPAPHASVASNSAASSAANSASNSPVLKPVGAYRPPGARGLAAPSIFKREDEGGQRHVYKPQASPTRRERGPREVPGATPVIPGAVPIEQTAEEKELSKTAAKNKKKRENKKKQEAEKGESTNGNSTPGVLKIDLNEANGANGAKSNGATVPPTPLTPGTAMHLESNPNPEAEKKLRGLQKKVKAIDELKMRQARGDKLEATQLSKMQNEDAILKEIEEVRKSMGML